MRYSTLAISKSRKSRSISASSSSRPVTDVVVAITWGPQRALVGRMQRVLGYVDYIGGTVWLLSMVQIFQN